MQDDPKLPPLSDEQISAAQEAAYVYREIDVTDDMDGLMPPLTRKVTRRHFSYRKFAEAIQLSAFNAGRLKGLEAGFDAGWKTAANWAGRDDLLSDMDSPALKADRAAAIDRIAKKEAK
jgi:hypothetical protein